MATDTIHVLLIEDNEDDAFLVKVALAEIPNASYELQWVSSLNEAIRSIEEKPVEVVLLDLSLSDSRGMDTLSTFRKSFPNIPAIIITGLDDENFMVRAIQAGAQDYIIKDHMNSYTLKHVIRHAIERQKLISNIKQLSGLLPICASCKNIRNDNGYWQRVEEYIREHSDVDFSHSMCPDCVEKFYPDLPREKKE